MLTGSALCHNLTKSSRCLASCWESCSSSITSCGYKPAFLGLVWGTTRAGYSPDPVPKPDCTPDRGDQTTWKGRPRKTNPSNGVELKAALQPLQQQPAREPGSQTFARSRKPAWWRARKLESKQQTASEHPCTLWEQVQHWNHCKWNNQREIFFPQNYIRIYSEIHLQKVSLRCFCFTSSFQPEAKEVSSWPHAVVSK